MINESELTIRLEEDGEHRPACTIYINTEKNVALRKLDVVTEKEFTKVHFLLYKYKYSLNRV